MLKLTAIVSLVLIATWSQADSRRHKKDASQSREFNSGSTMWAASLSCDSCGSECTSACGTRHFRSCCFNYLRRKRIPDAVKFTPQNGLDTKSERSRPDLPKPVFVVDSIPEAWMSNGIPSQYRPYRYEDMYFDA